MSKQIKIGLLSIISAVGFYTGFNFLKGSDFMSQIKVYYIYFDNVNGLTISNSVMLNGLQVGRVNNIEVLQKENNRMKVELQIRSDIELGKGTVGELSDNGLLGGKMIDLKVSKEKPLLDVGGTIVGKIKSGMVAELTQKADPIIHKVDTLLGNINKLVQGLNGMQGDLKTITHNLKEMSGSLTNTLQKGAIDQMLQNANLATQNLNKLLQGFQPLTSKLDTILSKVAKLELQETINKAKDSMTNLNGILADIKAGKGSIGALMKTDSLHRGVVKTTTNQHLTSNIEQPTSNLCPTFSF
ncbi:MAG: MCE family protein [Bacteroidetes bacterium]|nr:MAG: MCE family protein [Bacteroidota bacterium]